jgi:predicted DNA-binding transcriptional regulator AlpA
MKSEHPQLEAEGVAVDRSVHSNLTAESPAKPKTLSEVLAELARLLPKLNEALERQPKSAPAKPAPAALPLHERLTLRIDELADALGVSRRVIERERSAGRFPAPNLTIGKMPLWCVESIREWMEQQAQGRRVNP